MDKEHFGKNWDFFKLMDYPISDQLFKWLLISSIVNDGRMVSRGRLPWMIKPAAIIVITDGGKLTSSNQLKPELIIPGSTLPGSEVKPYPIITY